MLGPGIMEATKTVIEKSMKKLKDIYISLISDSNTIRSFIANTV
jgi:hypothetical protein